MERNDLIKIGLIIIAGLVLIYVINIYKNKSDESESFVNVSDDEEEDFSNNDTLENFHNKENNEPIPSPSEGLGNNEIFSELEETTENIQNNLPKDCFPKDQLSPDELLPGDMDSKWAQVNPSVQGKLGDQNFLSSAYHVGVNTVGQTLRNANLQIRSEPSNPQIKVSPWLQSTIQPDTNRKPLEIGGCE
jgi:hypothetical protein